MDNTKDSIRAFLSKFIRQDHFSDKDNLFEKGYVSSLLAMELVTFVETEFCIKVGNEDLSLENFNSVDAISRLIQRKTGAPSQ